MEYSAGFIVFLVFFLVLLALIAVWDVRTREIPDLLNALLAVAGAAIAFERGSFDVVALVLGVGFLGAQWLLSGGRWIGSGDVLMMVGLGLALPSWQHLTLALAISYVSGACVAILLLLTHHAHTAHRIPFGPFLAAGGGMTMLFGRQLMEYIIR